MKNAFVRLISRLDTPEKRISELEDISIGMSQFEMQKVWQQKENPVGLGDITLHSNYFPTRGLLGWGNGQEILSMFLSFGGLIINPVTTKLNLTTGCIQCKTFWNQDATVMCI